MPRPVAEELAKSGELLRPGRCRYVARGVRALQFDEFGIEEVRQHANLLQDGGRDGGIDVDDRYRHTVWRHPTQLHASDVILVAPEDGADLADDPRGILVREHQHI